MPRLPTVLLLSLLTWTATAGALTLSDDERAWLADHQELRLGVDASWPPFEYRDENGRYQGLAADYVRLIQDRLGVRVKLIEPANWSAVLEQARNNQLDLLPGIDAEMQLREWQASRRDAELKTLLAEVLPKRFAQRLCEHWITSKPLRQYNPPELSVPKSAFFGTDLVLPSEVVTVSTCSVPLSVSP